MNPFEKKAVSALAGVVALRMAGLFLPLPVLAVYAAGLPDATPFLVGLALGVYGATQAALQIALGAASDRFGRKAVITAGLLVFAAGGIIAGLAGAADSIAGLITGRAVQGAGAVSAAALALTADLTREPARAPAMAVIGVTIGAMFILSLVAAPPLQGVIGVAGIFYLSAGLAAVAMALLWLMVPNPRARVAPTAGSAATNWRALAADAQLMRLNFGAFGLHFALTAVFVALPPLLQAQSGLALASHWKIYAPVLALSVAGMLPLVLAARGDSGGAAFAVAVGLLAAACAGLATAAGDAGLPMLLAALWLFFAAFNALEALLPAQVSRRAPAAAKGAALGVCQTFQFLGMFAGGASAGWVSGTFGAPAVFYLCAAVAGVWLAAVVCAPRKN